MKRARVILVSAAVLLAVLVIGVALALNSSVQTWAARKWLAANPELGLTIGRVSSGFRSVELTDVRLERDGIRLRAPSVIAEMNVLTAAWNRHLIFSSLVAKGWVLTVVQSDAGRSFPAATAALQASGADASARMPGPVSEPRFTGIFALLNLPLDVAVDRLVLNGRIEMPGTWGTADIDVSGGGLREGETGAFDVGADLAIPGQAVAAIQVKGRVGAAMDSPRTFTDLKANLQATATGPNLAHAVELRLDAAAARNAAAESYSITAVGHDRELLSVQARLPGGSSAIAGEWKLDMRDTDVAPFLLGRAIPVFAAVGGGKLESHGGEFVVHAVGTLDAIVDKLASLSPDLSGVGAIRLGAEVDVTQRGEMLDVANINVSVATREAADAALKGTAAGTAQADPAIVRKPVAIIRTLQPFQFNPRTREIRPTDAASELVGVALHGVPLTWVKPFTPGFDISGSDVRGEFVATPRAGGLTFRSKAPLTISRLQVRTGGQPLAQPVDVSLMTAGDYTPQGWQAELTGFTAKTGASTVLLLDAKAGQLAGEGQPVKATGLLTVDLSALLAQPFAGASRALTDGDATIEFAANLGKSARQIQATVATKNLAADPRITKQPLPTFSTTVRADLTEGGKLTLNAPITLERDGRTSDITIVGTGTLKEHGADFEAQATSSRFVIDDARPLTVLLRGIAAGSAAAEAPRRPAWAGWNGSLALQLKEVIYTGTATLSDVTGRLRIAGNAVTFENVRAGVGESGRGQVNGSMRYEPRAVEPFTVRADIELTDVDLGPLLRAINPGEPPVVEGIFAVAASATARAETLRGLPRSAVGRLELTSKRGTFRGLSVNVGNLVENSGKLSSWLASAGHAITSIGGRKDYDDDEIRSRSQAANELAKLLSAITYDQLGIIATRDEAMNTVVREITLISPELRITGSGEARAVPGQSIANDVFSFEYRVRARGRPAELMNFLGVLEPGQDDLGYAACTLPVHVEGTLARLDTTELSNRLVALAVQKTGLTEKAVDWITRLRGK